MNAEDTRKWLAEVVADEWIGILGRYSSAGLPPPDDNQKRMFEIGLTAGASRAFEQVAEEKRLEISTGFLTVTDIKGSPV